MLGQVDTYLVNSRFDLNRPALFLFDNTQDQENHELYEQGFTNSFTFWMYIPNGSLIRKCSAIVVGHGKSIAKYLTVRDQKKGFLYPSFCIYDNSKDGPVHYTNFNVDVFYPVDSFFAFELKDRAVIDIKEQVVRELDLR